MININIQPNIIIINLYLFINKYPCVSYHDRDYEHLPNDQPKQHSVIAAVYATLFSLVFASFDAFISFINIRVS